MLQNNTAAEDLETAKILLRMTGFAFVCLLLALLPVRREQEFLFFLKGMGLSGAFVISWITAGSSTWAAVRVQKRQIVVSALLSVPLALASTAYAYYLFFILFL